MITTLAISLALISIFTLLVNPRMGLLITFISRPIMDLAWESAIMQEVNTSRVFGVLFPVIILIRMSLFTADRPSHIRFMKLWVFYVITNIIGFSIMATNGHILSTVSLFFKIMNGVVAYF